MLKPCFTHTTTNDSLSRIQRRELHPTNGTHTIAPNSIFNLYGENGDDQKESNEKTNKKDKIMDPSSV